MTLPTLRARLAKLVPGADDTAVFGGLALLTTGIWQLSHAWACIIAGAIVFLMGCIGTMRRTRR